MDLEKIEEENRIILSKDELLESKIICPYDVKQEIWQWFQDKKTGFDLPWKSWSDLFKLVKGELTIVSGYSGHGKSDFVNQIALHCIKQNVKVFISSLELSPGNLYGRLLKQATGQTNPTYNYLTRFVDFYEKKLFAYDLMGTANVDEVLKSADKIFDIAGTELFIFDNLMMLNSLVDDFKMQFEICQKILRFCKDKNVKGILVAHSRKPSKGMPIPTMYDVAGSSNIINMVDNHISVTKNITKEKALSKPESELTDNERLSLTHGDALILRDKKREIGETFFKSLYFDKRYNIFKEYESEKPFNYLEEKYI